MGVELLGSILGPRGLPTMNHLNYEFDADAGDVADVTLDREPTYC